MDNSRQIEFFNLNNDGDSAIVRLLHSKVETIESASIHRISVDGKYKNVKCPGEGCDPEASGGYHSQTSGGGMPGRREFMYICLITLMIKKKYGVEQVKF